MTVLAERARNFGGLSEITPVPAMLARLYLLQKESAVLAELIGAVRQSGYLAPMDGNVWQCRLTLDGWKLTESLRQRKAVGSQAFVAMWFSPSMDPAFDEGFFPALKACGYQPYRVDREQHNNKIDDQIVANIRKSRLLVADLTGLRPNVMYEAGFAQGLGTPCIFTCHETDVGRYVREDTGTIAEAPWTQLVEQRAFDVRQYMVMRWMTPADLATKLQNRIEALALALKVPAVE